MKKLLLIFVAVATLSIFSVQQSKAEFSAGLRIGFNASKYTGDLGSSYKFAPGLHIGPYFRVGFKEKYRVQIDLLFSTKGAVTSSTLLDGSKNKNYDIPFYLDLPIMFNYKPIAGLYIEAGVQPSFALTSFNFGTYTDSEFYTNSEKGIKSLDFAPIVGLGYEFKKVSLGLRGAFGVTNFNKASSDLWSALTTTPSQKNMTLMATFGFKF